MKGFCPSFEFGLQVHSVWGSESPRFLPVGGDEVGLVSGITFTNSSRQLVAFCDGGSLAAMSQSREKRRLWVRLALGEKLVNFPKFSFERLPIVVTR